MVDVRIAVLFSGFFFWFVMMFICQIISLKRKKKCKYLFLIVNSSFLIVRACLDCSLFKFQNHDERLILKRY